jgi:hypothetical protein
MEGADLLEEPPEDRAGARSLLVEERRALDALRTPPVGDPPDPIMDAADESPPPGVNPAALLAEVLAILDPMVDPPLEEPPLDEPPEEPPEEPEPPPLEPPVEPPPPRRPMKAPPPPAKLRLPRSCGPRMVLNFSGPVVPVNRMISDTLPLITAELRTAAAAAFGAAACSATRLCHKNAPAATSARTKINNPQRNGRRGRSTGETGVSFRSGGAGVEGAGVLYGCMTDPSKPRNRWFYQLCQSVRHTSRALALLYLKL